MHNWLMAWQRAEWDPKLLPQKLILSNTLVSSLSKADRVTHKNTKTFIQSWLENLSCKRSSLKPINYDLFEYLRPNTSIRIRIQVTSWSQILFVLGRFSQTEYYSYSYSGDFLKPNIICIRIRAIFSNRILLVFVFSDFLKPNIICIWAIFSNLISFVFVFGWFSQTEYRWEFFRNTIHILLNIDTFDEWAPIIHKWAHENLSPHFHFSDDRIN